MFGFVASPSYSLNNTLENGQSLVNSQQLISLNKRYTLKFYRYPEGSVSRVILSENLYLAIVSEASGRPVWIANRDKPFRNTSDLSLESTTGKLTIRINRTHSVDFFPGQTTMNISSATLLNSGNFILYGGESAKEVLWQSFDYPTDTLLPGMKLGVNHRTGKNWTLRSGFSDDSPADGAFSLEWDPTGPRLVIKRRGVVYWASGNSKNKPFEFIHVDPFNTNYAFINASNENEESFSYKLTPTAPASVGDRNYLSEWVLRYDGQIVDFPRGLGFVSADNCYGDTRRDFPNLPSVGNLGCQLREQPKCRHSYQMFDLRSGGFRKPQGDFTNGIYYENSSFTISDCKEICWEDCDCVGYLNWVGGCLLWKGTDLTFTQDLSGQSALRPYVLISNPPKKKPKKWTWGAIAAVVSLFLLLLGTFGYHRRKQRQQKKIKLQQLMTLDGYTDTIELENDGGKGQDVKDFSYQYISAATNGFASENKLGQGGFGPVYMGKLSEGQKVAVKRLSSTSGQGLLEFKTELILIAKLQHRNLVKLLGYCIEGDEKMLVYEYMPNKSLDFFLFDHTRKVDLTWDKRFNIAKGIAQGLLYLHEHSRVNVVHRDLKASNILLDEQMNPKISDFGTARIFKQNSTESSTMKIAGTRGYMAPEYVFEGTFSRKSDVFSFGVLILEIVSGRRNNSFRDVEGTLNLVAYAWDLWNKDATIELMDPELNGSCTLLPNQVVRCIQIGLLCVQHNADDRPTMLDVSSMLSVDNSNLPLPKTPAFVAGMSNLVEGDQHIRKPEKNSINGLSISSIDAR